MSTECPNIYQELSNMQLKIASLFQDLMKERNCYKQNSENLSISIERLSAETENLRKHNKVLKELNESMGNLICGTLRVFKNIDFSSTNLKKEHKILLENLKREFLDTSRNLENSKSNKIEASVEFHSEEAEKDSKLNINRYELSEEEMQKEFEVDRHLNFSTQFFYDYEAEKSIEKKNYALNRSNSESVLKTLFERKPKNVSEDFRKLKNSFLVRETEIFDSEQINTLVLSNSCKTFQPSSKELLSRKSPVFKDFGSRKVDFFSNEENEDSNFGSSPFKLINEKIGEKSKNFIVSPRKKSSHVNGCSPVKESSTPKRTREKLSISLNRSPNAQLKMSNSREAEISISGVKKLTQTLLNIDCYKRKGSENWKQNEERENENVENSNGNIKSGLKKIVDAEDDFITESPKKIDHILEDVKNKTKSGHGLNKVQLITPPDTSDADLDETYISASVVKKCKFAKSHLLEKIIEDQTPLRQSARAKSPEYDSVPFVYKRDPLRKKLERMKLPGHACLECNKYYKNAFKDIDTQNLKRIINKCSRHRDKYSPTSDETPVGYWKPYLTSSVIMSPGKGDV